MAFVGNKTKYFQFLKRFFDMALGTRAEEVFWRFRHIVDRTWAQGYVSPISIAHPHRKQLCEILASHAPFESVLEIGCASGPNLYLFAHAFPHAKFYGVDISGKAIEVGKKWFREQNMQNVSLVQAKACELSRFDDKSIDIVISDAVLVCIAPDMIDKAIQEMLRVARRAIILIEWHSDASSSFYDDYWVHNYKMRFRQYTSENEIICTKIRHEAWSSKWLKYGHIIEAQLPVSR